MPITFSYTPLPSSVRIGKSNIEGMGIIAQRFIKKGEVIGISHVPALKEIAHYFHNGIIRTPLGGYLNHSVNPNCMIVNSGAVWHLYADDDIHIGEELCVDYRLYACGLPEVS